MVAEQRVEHLADAVDGRLPRADRDVGRDSSIAGSYKTGGAARRTVGDGAAPRARRVRVRQLGHAGPNNLMLWASGAEFGFRRAVPHVLGTAVGIGAMALAVAAGLGALVRRSPPSRWR